MCFVDLEKIYWGELWEYGVSLLLQATGLCIIKVRAVHISGTKSGMFSVDVGLHQG